MSTSETWDSEEGCPRDRRKLEDSMNATLFLCIDPCGNFSDTSGLKLVKAKDR